MSRGKKFKPYNLNLIEGIENDSGITPEEIIKRLSSEDIYPIFLSRGILSSRIDLHPDSRASVRELIGIPLDTSEGGSPHEGTRDTYEAQYNVRTHSGALSPVPKLNKLARELRIGEDILTRKTYVIYIASQKRT